MWSIAILRFKAVDLESVKAFLSVEVDSGNGCRITLHGLKLVVSKKDGSLFLGTPQRKGDDDKYYSHYQLSPALRDEILSQAKAKLEAEAVTE